MSAEKMRVRLRLLLCFACACAVGQAQGQVARVYISAPTPSLISGEQIQLTAVARDGNGRVIPGARFNWNSHDPGVLQVDSQGRVTGLRMGHSYIDAETQGVYSTITLQVLPRRIEVTPSHIELFPGQQQQFTATPYDIDQNPIPDVTFEWRLETDGARITPEGLLTARTLGAFTVQAAFYYDHGIGANMVEGYARVEVTYPKEFQLTRLLSSGDVRHSFQLRPPYQHQPGALTVNDAGQVAFLGSLDGLAGGLLLYENGRFDMLLAGGTPLLGRGIHGEMVDFIQGPAINNRGEVLVAAGNLTLASPSGSTVVMIRGESLGPFSNMQNFGIGRDSLNDRGEILFQAGFQRGRSMEYATGLFRASGGSPQAVWLSGRELPGLGVTTSFNPLGLDGAGTGYFLAWDEQGAQGLYRVAPDSVPEKVLAVGDPFASSTVQSISGEAGIAEDGDVAYLVWLEDGSQHVVWLSGEQTKTLPVMGGVGVYSVSREAGVLFEADAGRGGGLYRWTGEAVLPVLLYNRLAPNEEPLRQVDAAAMTSTGEVYAQVRTAGNDFVVLQPGGPMPVLFSAGDTVAVEANFFIQPYNFLVRGTGSGSARVLLGMPGSLFELGPGGPHPLLVLGDRLSGGEAFQGVWTYPPGVENSLGDGYLVSNNSGLLWLTAGRVETIVPAHSLASDGASLHLRGGIGVNDRGVVVFSAATDQGQGRLYLWEDGRLELLACTGDSSGCAAPNPAGGTVEYWQEEEYAVDEQGRVMAFFQIAGGPAGYYLFSNGRWEATALLDESQIEGKTVTSVASVQAVDNRFYAVFSRNTNQSMDTIAVLEGQTWRPLLTVKQAFPNQELGQARFDTLLDVNRRGELAFSVNGNTVAFHSSESTKIVHSGNKETADGDFLLQHYQLDLRDDGRLYFTARNQRDETVVYLAEPETPPRQTPSRFPVPFRSRQHPR